MKLARIPRPERRPTRRGPRSRSAAPTTRSSRSRPAASAGATLAMRRSAGSRSAPTRPSPIGHELAGVVAEIGRNVRGVKVGTRVALHPRRRRLRPRQRRTPRAASRSGCWSVVRPRARALFPIPDSMSFEQAALAEPLGVGMHAVDQANVRRGDKVAILGAGAIGLSAGDHAARPRHRRRLRRRPSRRLASRSRRSSVSPTSSRRSRRALWEALGEIHGRQTFFGAELVDTNVFIEATGSGGAARRGGGPLRAGLPASRSSPCTASRSRSTS
jgi:threonine dehydrogenase-like Zn-dependent dehydrogenase